MIKQKVDTMQEIEFPFDTKKMFEKSVKNNQLPRNDFKKQAILIEIVKLFEDKRKYLESEINQILKKYFEDVALLRRELVNFGYLEKDSYTSEYWVKKRKLYEEDLNKNTLLRRHKESFSS